MNALEAHAVEKPGGVADDHQRIGVRARHRKEAALGNRFRTVADHRAALEHLGDRRMLFEPLQLVVRIGRRILVVQTGNHADVEDVAAHAVDEAAAERLRRQRISERVNDRARFETIVGELPQLFDARRVDLRLALRGEVQTRNGLLCERPTRALTEHDDLRKDVRAGLVVRFRRAVVIEAFVAGAHADDAIALPQQLLPGKRGKDLRAGFFRALREPDAHLLQRGDVLSVIVQRRRRKRRFDLAARRQEPEFVTGHRRFDRCTLAPLRQQLVERARIHHRAGDAVIADLGGFFDHEDLECASGLLREPAEPNRARQARRAGADEEDVYFKLVAFGHTATYARR